MIEVRGQGGLAGAAPAEPLGWLQKPYSTPAMVEAVRQGLADLKADSG
jgi:hypothetical protein